MTVSDTIAAISTPPGEGAIALVRVSGANAVQIADKIFRGKETPSRFASHVQHLGEIFSAENQLIDQAVVSVHRAPASYTGEDLAEISCHGGTLVSAKVLEACLRAGARAARPGEFTERAFLNGKMDLTQAEAVIDLIRARTDLALRSATEQLQGRLGDQIRKIRDELIALLAHINASIDFPEEGRLASYFGIVPRVRNSNETEHSGHITKRSSKLGRTALVQCALIAKRYSPYLHRYYERIRARRGTGKAIIALARKFLSIIYYTLKNNWIFEDFPNFVLAEAET